MQEKKTAEDLRPLLRPWLGLVGQRSACTAKNYGVAVSRFLDEVGDHELTPDVLVDYQQSLTATLSVGSQAMHISATKSFLRACQAEGLIARSPVEWLRRPKVVVSPHNRWLTVSELRALMRAAEELGPVHAALMRLLWETGLRVSEAAAARWQDVFADTEQRNGLRVIGKGGRERVVRLSDEALEALALIRVGTHARTDTLDARDTTALFSRKDGTPRSSWYLWSKVKEAVRKAGIREDATCHMLRHSNATHAAANGADVFTIKEQLGHAKLETSQIYIAMTKGLEHGTIDHLPSLD
jgi:integrase/recombinase XerD